MKKPFALVLIACLALAGCSKEEAAPAEPEPAPEPVAEAPADPEPEEEGEPGPDPDELPLPEDFAAEATAAITAETYKGALKDLSKEIDSLEKETADE